MKERICYEIKEISPHIFMLDNGQQNYLYLFVGQQQCLLVDTGFGAEDLLLVIRRVTDLPVMVLCTHGHLDHIYGNNQFPQIFIHPEDIPLYEYWYQPKRRYDIGQKNKQFDMRSEIWMIHWAAEKSGRLTPILPGAKIDLGGKELEVISLKGHTPGSIGLLDCEERVLLTGDGIIAYTWMHLPEATSLREYQDTLFQLSGYKGSFDRLLTGHSGVLQADILEDLIVGVGRIIRGEVAGIPYVTKLGVGYRCDFGSCGVIYDPNRII